MKTLRDLARAFMFIVIIAALTAFGSCCYYLDHVRFVR